MGNEWIEDVKDRLAYRNGPFSFVAGTMKKLLALIGVIAVLAGGCASLGEFKYVSPDGKPSPFIPQRDPYRPPQDPTAR